MSTTDTTIRQALLSVLLAGLMVTAGCTGILSGESGNGVGTPTSTAAQGQHNNTSSAEGVDLRSISFSVNGTSASSELDRGDPKSGNKYYEPVEIAVDEGQVVNLVMQAEGDHNPALRIRNPDGNVSAIVSNATGNTTAFIGGEFAQSGRYTIEATSVEENTTFNYTLGIEPAESRERGLFEGDMSEWNQTEQHAEFVRDMGTIISRSNTTEYGSFPESDDAVRDGRISVNESGDYAVYTYELEPGLNFTIENRVDVLFMLTYARADEQYRIGLGNDPEFAEDGSWVPEIIFFKGVNAETGEVSRTTFLTRDWARDWIRQGGADGSIDAYAGNYYATLRYGPGHENYDPETGVTDAEFPQNYYDWQYPDNTTLAEEYGL